MSDNSTPKQGDHVFNDLSTAIVRPFETIKSLPEGRMFIFEHLVKFDDSMRELSERADLQESRKFTAMDGDEQDAFQRPPAQFQSLSRTELQTLHNANAAAFGEAASRYELATLEVVYSLVEQAIAPGTPQLPNCGNAFQQMFQSAYDPAAALVLILSRTKREAPPKQTPCYNVAFQVMQSLQRPANWGLPYANPTDTSTATGRMIDGIGSSMRKLESMRMLGMSMTERMRIEMSPYLRETASKRSGELSRTLHALHGRIQKLRG